MEMWLLSQELQSILNFSLFKCSFRCLVICYTLNDIDFADTSSWNNKNKQNVVRKRPLDPIIIQKISNSNFCCQYAVYLLPIEKNYFNFIKLLIQVIQAPGYQRGRKTRSPIQNSSSSAYLCWHIFLIYQHFTMYL